jgi:hypothetical protein
MCRRINLLVVVGGCAWLACFGAANGAIEIDGPITRDTVTGLEWLDLTASVGKSYNQVSSLFDAGEEFEGWRHAWGSEITTFLVSNFGLIANGVVPEAGAAKYNAVVGAIGQTAFIAGTFGLYYNGGIAPATVPLASVHASIFPPGSGTSIGTQSRSSSWSSQTVGHWLVRETPTNGNIPEPSAVVVWSGLAVGALIVASRRVRRNQRA